MKEKVSCNFIRFRDSKNNPTCTTNFQKYDEICQFLQTSHFGLKFHCAFELDKILLRRKDNGTLIPRKCCPLWKE